MVWSACPKLSHSRKQLLTSWQLLLKSLCETFFFILLTAKGNEDVPRCGSPYSRYAVYEHANFAKKGSFRSGVQHSHSSSQNLAKEKKTENLANHTSRIRVRSYISFSHIKVEKSLYLGKPSGDFATCAWSWLSCGGAHLRHQFPEETSKGQELTTHKSTRPSENLVAFFFSFA